MTKTEYREYLQSEHWRELRRDLLQEVKSCERCTMPRWLAEIAYDQDLHAHHKSYANLGKQEEIGDLEVLCRRCHEMETFGRTELKSPKEAICQACGATHWDYRSDFCPPCDQVLHEPYIYCLAGNPYPFEDNKLKTIGDYIRQQLYFFENSKELWTKQLTDASRETSL